MTWIGSVVIGKGALAAGTRASEVDGGTFAVDDGADPPYNHAAVQWC